MSLSRRDFRPSKRTRFVAGPPRRKPVLRILLLAGFGALVYLKFDSFVASRAFRQLTTTAGVRY